MKFILYLLLFLAFIFVIGHSLDSNAKSLPSFEQRQALHLKELQTKLMVASLSCNFYDEYNRFSKKYSKELKSNAVHLREYFGTEEKLNEYVTSVANKESRKSLNTELKEYCTASRRLFDNY